MIKKLIAILLVMLFVIPLATACGDTEDTSSAVSVEESQASVAIKDMEERVFNIYCHDFGAGSKSILGYSGEVLYDEEEPDSVDEAKKEVIARVEEAYNCTITGVVDNAQTTVQLIRNAAASGTHDYDFFFDSVTTLSQLVSEGALTDLNTVSTLNFTDPWWDQNAVEDLSICNSLYFCCGDINTYDNQGTWCVLFNKDLKTTLGVPEDFYDMARNYEWTYDKFVEICRREGYSKDLDGDGDQDEEDQWAFGTETYNLYVQCVSAGLKVARKDSDDIPYLTMSEEPESTVAALLEFVDFYNETDVVMVGNYAPYTNKGFENVWEATVHRAFIEGRELFYMCGLINVASFREMDNEFGILPIPLYNEGQDEYYHTVSVHNMSVVSIPYGVKDLDDVGLIISALAKESKELVTPAYYDIQLKYRDAKDEESGEMLDMIFASRSFDIGASFNWGSILAQYMGMTNDVASRFESILGSAETALEETVENVLANQELG